MLSSSEALLTWDTQGDLLAQVALDGKHSDVRLAAVGRLDSATHGDVLARVAAEDEDKEVRRVAKDRLAESHKAQAEDGSAPDM
jgi:hypothetical protein